jgi:hypothetical protein
MADRKMNFEEVPKFEIGYTETTINPDDYIYSQKAPLMAPITSGAPDFSAAAILEDTLPYRAGVASAFMVDEIFRSFDPNDDLRKVDANFIPFDVFKENGHTEDEFDAIMEMDNYQQYSRYMERKGFRDETRQKIQAGGLPAGAASLAANLFSDPTLYAGFGATKMLASGLSRTKAFAISGALSGAAYEGIVFFRRTSRCNGKGCGHPVPVKRCWKDEVRFSN